MLFWTQVILFKGFNVSKSPSVLASSKTNSDTFRNFRVIFFSVISVTQIFMEILLGDIDWERFFISDNLISNFLENFHNVFFQISYTWFTHTIILNQRIDNTFSEDKLIRFDSSFLNCSSYQMKIENFFLLEISVT